MQHVIKLILILTCVIGLAGCKSENKQAQTKTLTVQKSSGSNRLYYSGTIQPLKTVVVASPTDGVIIDKPYEYGASVKKNDQLFVISSSKFLSDYKTALLAFVKAKSEFSNNKSLLSEAKFLHSNELISEDDFKMKQSNYYASQLAFLQAKDALQSLIAQLDKNDINLFNLDIAEVEKITEAMQLHKNAENIPIVALASGILLGANKSESENKKFSKGDSIKSGEVLAIIGDMAGFSIKIKVNELTVNQLRIGQAVKVSGVAFPEESLEGEIMQIDHQGETSGSGLPTFSVMIAVKHLTQKQQKEIHIGMSAKVEIIIDEDAHLSIPINALFEKEGKTYVKRYQPQTKKTIDVAVSTGKTSIDSVAILSGLNPGDQIVLLD